MHIPTSYNLSKLIYIIFFFLFIFLIIIFYVLKLIKTKIIFIETTYIATNMTFDFQESQSACYYSSTAPVTRDQYFPVFFVPFLLCIQFYSTFGTLILCKPYLISYC